MVPSESISKTRANGPSGEMRIVEKKDTRSFDTRLSISIVLSSSNHE